MLQGFEDRGPVCRWWIAVLVIGSVIGLTAAAPASADTSIDLLTQANIRIDGAFHHYSAGHSVASAGDVNGDGIDDVIIDSPDAGPPSGAGRAYVVYGQPAATNLNLGSLGNRGFQIEGAALLDILGTSVAGAGDVNGDGFDDVIVGAPGVDGAEDKSGEAYVIYGQAATENVNVGSLNGRGFRIIGFGLNDKIGTSVAGAGDVNGDGFDDVIVGSPDVSPGGRFHAGAAFVAYGRATSQDLYLSAPAGRGFWLDGAK